MTLAHAFSWTRRIFIVLVSCLLAAWILAWIFEDRLGRMVLSQLEKEVTTSLSVGEFNLSFIRAFPRIRGSFDEVILLDTEEDTLLQLEKLAVRLKWSALWSDLPQIDALLLENGQLRLHLDEIGHPNYQVFQERSTIDSTATFQLDIRQATVRNLQIIYSDEQAKLAFQSDLDVGKFKIRIKDAGIVIDQDLHAHLVSWHSEAFNLAEAVTFSSEGSMRLVPDKEQVYFNKMDLHLAGLPFKLDGMVESSTNSTYTDIDLLAEDLSLATCWRLLQLQVPVSLRDLNPKGVASLELKIKGAAKGNALPGMQGELTLENSKIHLPGSSNMENLSMRISLDHPAGKSLTASTLHIHQCKAIVGGEPFSAQGKLTNLVKPAWDIHLKGRLPAFFVTGDDLAGESGYFEIEDLSLRGDTGKQGIRAEGHVRPDKAMLRYKGDPIHVPSGRLSLSPQSWELQDIRCQVAGSELQLNGTLAGMQEFLSSASGKSIRIQGRVAVPQLDLTALLAQINKWQENPSTGNQNTVVNNKKFDLPIRGDLIVDIDAFSYEDIRGKQFHGKVRFGADRVILSGDADAMGGHFNLEGELVTSRPMVMEGALTCEKVDVREAFRQCQDFGQDFITRDHIKGVLSSQVAFRSHWDSQGRFMEDKLQVYAAVQIDNGELVNFKVLESLSDYVHTKDLRHIKFTTLQNYLEVDRGMIYLPRMLIQSNALALDVTGTHTFDQRIDYGMRVDAGQVLIHKMAKHDPSLSPKPNKKKGWFNLYYHIGGSVEDYAIKSDRSRVKGDFVRSAVHRIRIREHLMQLFGDLIFTEEEGEEEVFAIGKGEGGLFNNEARKKWNETFTPRAGTTSIGTDDGEYLEDFEIEGGSAKRRY